MAKKILEFKDICPIVNIDDGVIINGDGSVTAGIDILIQPEVYTFSIEDYNNAHELILTALNQLPPNTTVHKQDFFYLDHYHSEFKEEYGTVFRENLTLYNSRPILKTYSKIYLTFSVSTEIKRSEWPWNTVLGWIDKKNFKFLSFVEDNIENITQSFMTNLNTIKGFRVKRMNTDDLFCSFYEYYSLTYNIRTSDAEKVKKTLLPNYVFDNHAFSIGSEYVSVVSLIGEGERLLSCVEPKVSSGEIYGDSIRFRNDIGIPQSYVFPMGIGFPTTHILNTVIEIKDNERIINHLKSEKFKLNLGKSIGNENARLKQNNIDTFNTSVTEENLRTCITNVNMILHNPDLTELHRLSKMALSAISNMKNAQGYIEVQANYHCFMNSSPGNAKTLKDPIVSTTHQSACYFHLEGQYFSDPKGIMYVDRFGAPVIINRWDSPDIVNRNVVEIGTSGSGKSFRINGDVTQLLNQGNDVIIIDIGHSYERNAHFENAKYYNSAKLSEFKLNMFLCEKDKDGNYYIWGEDEESKFDVVNKLFSILTVIWKGNKEYSDGEDTILKEIIINFYDYINLKRITPNVNSFLKYLDVFETETIESRNRKFIDLDSLRLSLRDFCTGGMYGDLLNAEENLDIVKDKFVIFDLEAVGKQDKKLFSIISVIIIDIILSKIKKKKGVRKTLIIDEAIEFLQHPIMGPFIADFYRTFRKKDGQVHIATQDSSFFMGLPEINRNSILRNSDTKIIHDHSKHLDAIGDLVKLGIIAPKHIALLKSLKRDQFGREFLLILGDKPMVLLNEVSYFAGLVYTSVQSDVIQIDELEKKYHNAEVAIREFHEKNLKLKTTAK